MGPRAGPMGADGAILEVGEFVTHHITQLLILQWMKSTGNNFVKYASFHRGTIGQQSFMGFINKRSKILTILSEDFRFVWHSPDHMSRTR